MTAVIRTQEPWNSSNMKNGLTCDPEHGSVWGDIITNFAPSHGRYFNTSRQPSGPALFPRDESRPLSLLPRLAQCTRSALTEQCLTIDSTGATGRTVSEIKIGWPRSSPS
jgi:hypothetical protein